MPLLPGSRLGPFDITAQIGAGGMGAVYRGTDTSLGRQVAIKVLPEAFARDAERLARFEREAKTLAALNHPNIAAIYGFERSSGTQALVMELVEGEDLSQRIARGAIPIDEALSIAKQIAEALEAAHEQGIVHRDLKPANVKIRGDGTVKVLDFGLAKAVETGADRSRAESLANSPTLTIHATEAGIILGTAAYMSPEQAAGKPVDRRADIWALAVVLFEMLTARPVFGGETVSHVLASVLKSDPEWSALPAGLPPGIQTLLRRCLEKDQKRRLDSAVAVRLEIDAALTAPGPRGAVAEPTVQTRRGVVAWSVASLFMIATGVLLTIGTPWRAEKRSDRPLTALDVDLGADMSFPRPNSAGATFAISSDGTRLAYLSGAPPRLFVRRLDQSKAIELAGTQGASVPFFSPDGQWVGFIARRNASKISIQGGAVVPLVQNVTSARWADDGSVLAIADGSLVRTPAEGGTPAAIASPREGELDLGTPQLLPGGKAILFETDNPGPVERTTIDVITLADHRRTTVIRGGASPRYVTANGAGYLLYVNHATLFAIPFDLNTLTTRGAAVPMVDDVAHEPLVGLGQYDVSSGGTLVYRRATGNGGLQRTTVQWVEPSAKRTSLLDKAGTYQDPSVSPDGTRLALSISDGAGRDIWVYHLQRDTMTRVTFGGKVYRTPRWTADGRHLVFSDVGNGLVQARADGASQTEPLTQTRTYEIASSFSSDGKRLAYWLEKGGIWTLPVEERDGRLKAGAPEAFLKSGAAEILPVFSPDGRWIAYTSNESGINEVYVRAFPVPASGQGGRWQVSSNGGVAPHWSQNGRELMYSSNDQILSVAYSVKGDAFVPDKPRVWIANLNTAIADNGISWDLAPDGKRVVVMTPLEASEAAAKPEHEVVFVQNFFDELRRRVPLGK